MKEVHVLIENNNMTDCGDTIIDIYENNSEALEKADELNKEFYCVDFRVETHNVI